MKTVLLLAMTLLAMQACRKEQNENLATTQMPATPIAKAAMSDDEYNKLNEKTITQFLDNGHALKAFKLSQSKTGTEPVFENRTLTMDSADYYFSSGLNYLYANASGAYSDYAQDSIVSSQLEFPIASITDYAASLASFNTITAQVQSKKESLATGWNISAIMLVKELTGSGTLKIGINLDLGYKDPSMGKTLTAGMFSFPTTACYKWNYGTCTNPSWTSSGDQIKPDFRNKVRLNYPQRSGVINYPYKKMKLTDVANITDQLVIFPYEYDTYTNPYGAVTLEDPRIVPTEIYSYIGVGSLGSQPSLFLNGSQLNYYLDKSIDIIYDYRFGYKPTKHNAQWAKLANQTELLDFVLFPNGGDPSCPIGRRYGLNCCYSVKHEYRVSYCNYVIVRQPDPGMYTLYQ